MALPGCEIVV